MNLYQAGYFRKGRQGSGAGWGIVSPSKGMSQIAKDGFKGIAAKLVELKGTSGMPVVNTGLFLHDRFVYLMNVNYAAQGDDDRGVTYVHGYCFNAADYFELCADPNKICGITADNFCMEYDDTINAYPVAEQLAYEPMNFQELLAKYKLTDEEYRLLVLGAMNALENYSNPLCIRLTLPREEYLQASRELLYLIMKGLPQHLRIKASAYSFAGAGAAIYVSDHTEGNNCIDLDSREFTVDTTRLSQFGFTRIYNSIPAAAEAQRDAIFQAIADFMNAAFENPVKDAGCALIEAGFQEKIKKNDGEGILADKAEELMRTFLGCKLTDQTEVYDYLADLLKVMNDHTLKVSDSKIRKTLEDKYGKTNHAPYKREIDRLTAHEILDKNPQDGYKQLNNLTKTEEKYQIVCEEIRKLDEAYYREYYLKGYLPYKLTKLNAIRKYMEANHPTDSEECKELFLLLNQAMKKEMPMAVDYEQLKETQNQVQTILAMFPEGYEKPAEAIVDSTYLLLWQNFPIGKFETTQIEDYKANKVTQIAAEGCHGEKCPNAVNVVKLIEMFEEEDQEVLRDIMFQVLFTDQVLTTREEKKNIQELFKEEFAAKIKYNKASGFDCLLAMTYSFDKQKFHMTACGKTIARKAPELFSADSVRSMARNSRFLKDEFYQQKILEDLQVELKDVKKSKSVDKKIVKGLQTYCDFLGGKKIKNEEEQGEANDFLDGMHRIAIGAALIYVFEFLLKTWGSTCGVLIPIIGTAALATFMLIAAVIKIMREGGFEDMLYAYGITSAPKMVLHILVTLLLWAGIGVFMTIFAQWAVYGGIGYIALAAISAVLCFVKTEE